MRARLMGNPLGESECRRVSESTQANQGGGVGSLPHRPCRRSTNLRSSEPAGVRAPCAHTRCLRATHVPTLVIDVGNNSGYARCFREADVPGGSRNGLARWVERWVEVRAAVYNQATPAWQPASMPYYVFVDMHTT